MREPGASTGWIHSLVLVLLWRRVQAIGSQGSSFPQSCLDTPHSGLSGPGGLPGRGLPQWATDLHGLSLRPRSLSSSHEQGGQPSLLCSLPSFLPGFNRERTLSTGNGISIEKEKIIFSYNL